MANAALVVVAVADAAADEVVVTFAGVLKVVMAQPGRKRMKTNRNTLAASGEREREEGRQPDESHQGQCTMKTKKK